MLNGSWIFLVLQAAILIVPVRPEVKEGSACFGTGISPCYFLELQCDAGYKIHLLSQKYGIKESIVCNFRRNRCFDPAQDGCCVYDPEDCMEAYSKFHTYTLHRQCSGRQNCGPMQVPRNILNSCDGRTSTYVYILYECVPDSSSIGFCEERSISGPEVDIVFDRRTDPNTTPLGCSCFLDSPAPDTVVIDYADIRMASSSNGSPGTLCSSATLVNNPAGGVETICDPTESEEENFKFGSFWKSEVDFVETKLLNLYQTSPSDAPEMVWLKVSGEERNNVTVTCFKLTTDQTTATTIKTSKTPDVTTRPDTTSSTEASGNSTSIPTSQDDEDPTNTGAIVAGVLVPIIVIAIIAVVVFLIYKRRGNQFLKGTRKSTRKNSYVEKGCVEEEEEYAEIGFVPDIPDGDAFEAYRAEKETESKTSETKINGHTYQNVGAVEKGTPTGVAAVHCGQHAVVVASPSSQSTTTLKSQDGHPKQNSNTDNTINKVKTQAGKVISFFRKDSETSETRSKKGEKGVSGGSYDHLRPQSGMNQDFVLPDNAPNHVYSHTGTLQTPGGPNRDSINSCATDDAKDTEKVTVKETDSISVPVSSETKKDIMKGDAKPIDTKESKNKKVEKKKNNKIKTEDNVDNDEAKAVHVGDSYIEFKFGEVDETKLVKTLSNGLDERPEPPKRPPPSPKQKQLLNKAKNNLPACPVTPTTPVPKSTPTTSKSKRPSSKPPAIPKSPNSLSPVPQNPNTQAMNYDYADNSAPTSPVTSRRVSNESVSSDHSYRVLEPQPTYDYADADAKAAAEGHVELEEDECGAIYEDVEIKTPMVAASAGNGRSKSATLPRQDSSEYLEPMAVRNRTVSASADVKAPGSDDVNTQVVVNEKVLLPQVKKKRGKKNQSEA